MLKFEVQSCASAGVRTHHVHLHENTLRDEALMRKYSIGDVERPVVAVD
jgi:hypothetical protein